MRIILLKLQSLKLLVTKNKKLKLHLCPYSEDLSMFMKVLATSSFLKMFLDSSNLLIIPSDSLAVFFVWASLVLTFPEFVFNFHLLLFG